MVWFSKWCWATVLLVAQKGRKFLYVIHVWRVELGKMHIHNSSRQCRAHSGSPQIVGFKSVSQIVSMLPFTWNACCTYHTHIQWTIIWKSEHWIFRRFQGLIVAFRFCKINKSITCKYDTWDHVVIGSKYYLDTDAKQTGVFGHKFLTVNTAPLSLYLLSHQEEIDFLSFNCQW